MPPKIYVILVFVMSSVSCISPELPISSVQVVYPSGQEKRLIAQETIDINNCNSATETLSVIERSHTISYTLELYEDSDLVNQDTLGEYVARQYGAIYGQSITLNRSISLSVNPYSHVQFIVRQFEIWEQGTIVMTKDNLHQQLPFSFRNDFSLEWVSGVNLDCSVAAINVTPTPPAIQIAQNASIEFDMQPGDLEIIYPSQMRTKSSDRIDVFISLSDTVVSLDSVSVDRNPPSINRIPFSGNNPATIGNLKTYTSNIIISESMVATLSSPTFQLEAIYPAQQKISTDGTPTIWAWNVTAPNEVSTGILTLSLFKPNGNVSLEQLSPIWVGSISIEVVDLQPTPTQTLIPTATPVSTPTLIPTATPTFYEKARDSFAQTTGTMISGIIIAILTAIVAPLVIERWKRRSNITKFTAKNARQKIAQTNDAQELEEWLFAEQSKAKPRKTIIEALNKRITDINAGNKAPED